MISRGSTTSRRTAQSHNDIVQTPVWRSIHHSTFASYFDLGNEQKKAPQVTCPEGHTKIIRYNPKSEEYQRDIKNSPPIMTLSDANQVTKTSPFLEILDVYT